MKLDTIEIPRSVARKKLDALRWELRRRKKPIDDELERLRAGYEAAAEGRAVIQLSQVIEAGGYFDDGMPRIAVAPSHALRVRCELAWNGGDRIWRFRRVTRTGREMPVSEILVRTSVRSGRPSGRTIVPIVPSEVLQEAGVARSRLPKFVTLFEVERWDPVPPVDPALLEHIAGDLYAVLAAWDLTELERAVLAGTR